LEEAVVAEATVVAVVEALEDLEQALDSQSLRETLTLLQ
jgi:hypothetical protein